MAMAEFQDKLAKLQKALTATQEAATEAGTRLTSIRRAIDATPSLPTKLREETLRLERNLSEINMALTGDRIWRSHNEGVPASISEHVQAAGSPIRGTTGRPTKTAMEQYQIASDELAVEIPKLRKLIETDIKALEKQLDVGGRASYSGPPARLEGREIRSLKAAGRISRQVGEPPSTQWVPPPAGFEGPRWTSSKPNYCSALDSAPPGGICHLRRSAGDGLRPWRRNRLAPSAGSNRDTCRR